MTRVSIEQKRAAVQRTRATADEMAAMWGADDPLHPTMPLDPQPFRNWVDFVDRVARPLVEDDLGYEAVQEIMREFRKASPYFLCVALVMAANRAREAGAL